MELLGSISWSRTWSFYLPVSLCSLRCPVLLAFLFDPASEARQTSRIAAVLTQLRLGA